MRRQYEELEKINRIIEERNKIDMLITPSDITNNTMKILKLTCEIMEKKKEIEFNNKRVYQ